MGEDLNYSTVVFQSKGKAPKEANEDPTIYSTVASERRTNTVPKETRDSAAARPGKGTAAGAVPTARARGPCQLVVCSGVLCVLVLASVGGIIYISVTMDGRNADLAAQNAQLTRERSRLQTDMDDLNWTLGVILRFSTFPVNEYCPSKMCQPCRDGWTRHREKCYLFYDEPPAWKSWTDSLRYCQNKAADLVVIDSPREQEFVSSNIKFYYDDFHGYWMGLRRASGNSWSWRDGRNDTLGYWITEELGTPGSCAMVIPERNSTASWDPADCEMQNKLICESDVLIRSH